MRHIAAAVLAALCASLSAPAASFAQPTIYLRLLPEISALSIAHTKQVTSGAGSSSSTSSSIGTEVRLNFYAGVLASASGSWQVGGELNGAIAVGTTHEGDIASAGTGDHAVWPGTWEFFNRMGVGVNLVVARDLRNRNSRGFFFVGVSRWSSDFGSTGIDPATSIATEDRIRMGRWPLTAGIGVTLPFERSLDIRLRYVRSVSDWAVTDDPLQFDYNYAIHGLALSAGIGTR